MELQHTFGVLSEVIASYESGGGSVRAVETTSEPNGALQARLEVPVEPCAQSETGGTAPASATVTAGGHIRVEYSPADLTNLPLPDVDGVTTTGREASVTDDGDLVLSIDLRIEPPQDLEGPARPATGGARSDREWDGTDGETDRNGGAASESQVTTGGEGEASEDGPATSHGGPTTSHDGPAVTMGGERPEQSDASADPLETVRDSSVPPFEDVAYLRRLYESCDTFAEMSRRIEMDVSAETVRRYMTDAGVHQPESYEAGDGDPETGEASERGAEPGGASERGAETGGTSDRGAEPGEGSGGVTETATVGEGESGRSTGGAATGGTATADAGSSVTEGSETGTEGTSELPPDEHLVADGLGLPANLDIRDVVDAVVDARCLYDVTRSLDLDQERTRDLLVQLNLLDLVSHRLSTVQERETSFEDVAARIRQCSPEAT